MSITATYDRIDGTPICNDITEAFHEDDDVDDDDGKKLLFSDHDKTKIIRRLNWLTKWSIITSKGEIIKKGEICDYGIVSVRTKKYQVPISSDLDQEYEPCFCIHDVTLAMILKREKNCHKIYDTLFKMEFLSGDQFFYLHGEKSDEYGLNPNDFSIQDPERSVQKLNQLEKIIDKLFKNSTQRKRKQKTNIKEMKTKRSRKETGAEKKKPPNRYIRYSVAKRPEIVARNPEKKFGDISKLLGAQWRQMSESQKALF
jgi:hypothetical protein